MLLVYIRLSLKTSEASPFPVEGSGVGSGLQKYEMETFAMLTYKDRLCCWK